MINAGGNNIGEEREKVIERMTKEKGVNAHYWWTILIADQRSKFFIINSLIFNPLIFNRIKYFRKILFVWEEIVDLFWVRNQLGHKIQCSKMMTILYILLMILNNWSFKSAIVYTSFSKSKLLLSALFSLNSEPLHDYFYT